MPRQADCVGQIPDQWRVLGGDAMASTLHTFNTRQQEQTNSCQLQQGHQQNLLGWTQANILRRGNFSLFLLLYKIYIAYSYLNHFRNCQCLMVTWPTFLGQERKKTSLEQAPSQGCLWPASSCPLVYSIFTLLCILHFSLVHFLRLESKGVRFDCAVKFCIASEGFDKETLRESILLDRKKKNWKSVQAVVLMGEVMFAG